jgi:hypothetical protein
MEWLLSAVLGYVFLLLLIGLVLCIRGLPRRLLAADPKTSGRAGGKTNDRPYRTRRQWMQKKPGQKSRPGTKTRPLPYPLNAVTCDKARQHMGGHGTSMAVLLLLAY